MHADLDLLLTTAYCTADDLLPEPRRNRRRQLNDAEIVTLSVAQVLMGVPSDRRFLRAARRQLGRLFPQLPSQDALHKRRARLAEAIAWLLGIFAGQNPGAARGLGSGDGCDSHDRIDRTDRTGNARPICRFCQLCQQPAGTGVSPASTRVQVTEATQATDPPDPVSQPVASAYY